MVRGRSHQVVDAVRDCDRRKNKEYNDQVIAIRKEVGLPLDIRAFCHNNPECGSKIKNDYDYLDIKIFNLPPIQPSVYISTNPWVKLDIDPTVRLPKPGEIYKRPSNDPKYLAVRAKVDEMYEILKKMDKNLQICIENPSSIINY